MATAEDTIRKALDNRPWRLHYDGQSYEYTWLLPAWKDGCKWAKPERADTIVDVLLGILRAQIPPDEPKEKERA